MCLLDSGSVFKLVSLSLSLLCFVTADIISTVEFNSTGELLATGDKGGRVVVFQREQEVNARMSMGHPAHPANAALLTYIIRYCIYFQCI